MNRDTLDTIKQEPEEVPYATVLGKPFNDLPKDLYIPPGALKIILEAFSGPLDLLLYLIKRENINILDIPIMQVTVQYMEYVELMRDLNLELAAEYLVMAALLAEIKSKLLLPEPKVLEAEEEDPRAELVRRLREYEQFKQAALDLDSLPRVERDVFPVNVFAKIEQVARPMPRLDLQELISAFKHVLARTAMLGHHHINRESLSVRERMSSVLAILQESKFVNFEQIFTVAEGRLGVVVSFIAILELLRQNLIELVQAELYGPIHLKIKEEVRQ